MIEVAHAHNITLLTYNLQISKIRQQPETPKGLCPMLQKFCLQGY